MFTMTAGERRRQDRLERLVADSAEVAEQAHKVARAAVMSEVRFVEALVDRRGRDVGHVPERRS